MSHRTPAASLLLRAMHTKVFFWLAYILTLAHSVGGSVWRTGGNNLFYSSLKSHACNSFLSHIFHQKCWFFYCVFPPLSLHWHRRCHPWNINWYHFLCDLSCLQVSCLYQPVTQLHFVNSVRNPLFTENVVYHIGRLKQPPWFIPVLTFLPVGDGV